MIDDRSTAQADLDAGSNGGVEAGGLHPHRVCSRRQSRGGIETGLVGSNVSYRSGFRLRDDDGGSRYHTPQLILHRPGDGSPRSLTGNRLC